MSRSESIVRLLMVDDEHEFLEAVEPGLVRRGFEVTTAGNGMKALELLESREFDVVVLDVKMPGMDGVDVFRQIRKVSPDLPVILLTGHGSIQQAFETSREGVHEYLAKPCDTETLARVLRAAVEAASARRRATDARAEEIRLLLVDDDVEFVRSISPALERRGVRVTAVNDGRQALETIQGHSFQVAVVDVVMPGMDGLMLLDRLREEDSLLEVIVLTGNPRVGDVRRSLKEGAFDYLTKPCSVDELTRVIRSAGERRRDREENARRARTEQILSDRPD